MSLAPVMSSNKGSSYEEYIKKWERNPRAAQLEYLDLEVYPKVFTCSLKVLTHPCYHKNRTTDNHTLGRTSSDPQVNLLTDLTLSQSHNLSIIYDRQQAFAQEAIRKFSSIQKRLDQIEAHQEASVNAVIELLETSHEARPVEVDAVTLIQSLKDRLEEVTKILARLESLQQS